MTYAFYIGLGYGAFFSILGFFLFFSWRAYRKTVTSDQKTKKK